MDLYAIKKEDVEDMSESHRDAVYDTVYSRLIRPRGNTDTRGWGMVAARLLKFFKRKSDDNNTVVETVTGQLGEVLYGVDPATQQPLWEGLSPAQITNKAIELLQHSDIAKEHRLKYQTAMLKHQTSALQAAYTGFLAAHAMYTYTHGIYEFWHMENNPQPEQFTAIDDITISFYRPLIIENRTALQESFSGIGVDVRLVIDTHTNTLSAIKLSGDSLLSKSDIEKLLARIYRRVEGLVKK